MKTEEEARQCWCPAVRFTGAGTATDQEWGTNRGQDHGPEAFTCIASECMAWRWVTEPIPNPNGAASLERPFVAAQERGWCGLAGKP